MPEMPSPLDLSVSIMEKKFKKIIKQKKYYVKDIFFFKYTLSFIFLE